MMNNHRGYSAHPRKIAQQGLLTALFFGTVFALTAPAQTYSVIHNFSGADGANPISGLTIDAAGRLYGATAHGGIMSACQQGCGVVYRLSRAGAGWIVTPLYKFSFTDGASPIARPVFGPGGLLYGTTLAGGSGSPGNCDSTGCGTIYALSPPANACTTALCSWLERKLILFPGTQYPCVQFSRPLSQLASTAPDSPESFMGGCPQYGDLVFDRAGNGYGSVADDGVYQLTSEGTLNTVYDFTEYLDGGTPTSQVVFDSMGNMYGTTSFGGEYSDGVVYEISPLGSGWTEKVLYSFACGGPSGCGLFGGLVRDAAGNLYGAAAYGGAGGGGTVFELSPSGSTWTFNVLYSFSDTDPSAKGPVGSLVMDASGSLYGTTVNEGVHSYGSVFRLMPSNGSWTFTTFHDFGADGDGIFPYGTLSFDANGNLYGTAAYGGANGDGIVWEITP